MTKQKQNTSPKADQIDFRVQSNTDKGAIILAYKDARCDMKILTIFTESLGGRKAMNL